MNKTEMQNEYFQWLCDLVQVNHEKASYWILAQELHKKKFKWFIPHDDNRAMDGEKLRDEFAEEMRYRNYEALETECSMFEMLIALAKRVDIMTYEPHAGNKLEQWFWDILGNVGLTKYTDDEFYRMHGTARVDHILNTINERKYKRNGEGGLFPLHLAKKDQRKVEIWYQMSAFLDENYYIGERIL
jgi:hypothetical protein